MHIDYNLSSFIIEVEQRTYVKPLKFKIMRIKKHSPGKKTTSFRRLKLILLLAFNRPKEKDRKTFKDLVLEMIPIPTCVKCTPLFTLKLTKMCVCDSKLPEPTREDLVEIERQFDYLFNY